MGYRWEFETTTEGDQTLRFEITYSDSGEAYLTMLEGSMDLNALWFSDGDDEADFEASSLKGKDKALNMNGSEVAWDAYAKRKTPGLKDEDTRISPEDGPIRLEEFEAYVAALEEGFDLADLTVGVRATSVNEYTYFDEELGEEVTVDDSIKLVDSEAETQISESETIEVIYDGFVPGPTPGTGTPGTGSQTTNFEIDNLTGFDTATDGSLFITLKGDYSDGIADELSTVTFETFGDLILNYNGVVNNTVTGLSLERFTASELSDIPSFAGPSNETLLEFEFSISDAVLNQWIEDGTFSATAQDSSTVNFDDDLTQNYITMAIEYYAVI